jgi:hypothetical protein
LNQNLKNAKEDLIQGRLTLQQATSNWDVTIDELLSYIIKEQGNEDKNVCNTQGSN